MSNRQHLSRKSHRWPGFIVLLAVGFITGCGVLLDADELEASGKRDAGTDQGPNDSQDVGVVDVDSEVDAGESRFSLRVLPLGVNDARSGAVAITGEDSFAVALVRNTAVAANRIAWIGEVTHGELAAYALSTASYLDVALQWSSGETYGVFVAPTQILEVRNRSVALTRTATAGEMYDGEVAIAGTPGSPRTLWIARRADPREQHVLSAPHGDAGHVNRIMIPENSQPTVSDGSKGSQFLINTAAPGTGPRLVLWNGVDPETRLGLGAGGTLSLALMHSDEGGDTYALAGSAESFLQTALYQCPVIGACDIVHSGSVPVGGLQQHAAGMEGYAAIAMLYGGAVHLFIYQLDGEFLSVDPVLSIPGFEEGSMLFAIDAAPTAVAGVVKIVALAQTSMRDSFQLHLIEINFETNLL